MILLGTRPTARIVKTVYPFGTLHRCTGCGCSVSPTAHQPGSQSCHDARTERDESQRS